MNIKSNDKNLLAEIKGKKNIAKLCNTLDKLIARNRTSKLAEFINAQENQINKNQS